MANISSIKLPNGTTYSLKDNGALQLTGGQVTGPVTFGDSIYVDDLTAGQLVVEGNASVANNLQVNTINTYAISSSATNNTIALRTANGYIFATYFNQSSGAETPTTSSYIMYANSDGYLRKSSLANIKTILGLGSAAYTNSTAYLPSNHTYTTSIATSSATNQITLAYGTKYAITAGGTSYVFTMPSADDTNTWRGIQVDGTDILGTATNTNKLNLKAGTGISLSNSSGTVTITNTSTNTDTKLQVAEVTSATQYYPIVGTGTTAATRQYDTTGFKYKGTTGTTSAVGSAILELGNSTASGTAGNKQAQLIMYGSNAKKATITLAAPSADIALALPTSGGTIALTSQLPSVPTQANSATTGISIAAHSSTSIYGVKSTTTTASKASGGNGSAPSLSYTARSVGSASGWSQGSFTAEVSSHVLSFTFVKPTLTVSSVACDDITAWSAGSASTWSFTDVTVPIRNDSTTTVVTSTGHTITDPGHTHTIS